jgi:hypothetical protein
LALGTLAISLSSLKSLSISLSDIIIEALPAAPTDFSQPPKEKEIRAAKTKATAPSNLVGLADFYGWPAYSTASYYRLDTARYLLRDPYAHHERPLKQVAGSEKLPKLEQRRLRGIYTADADSLAFIQRTATRRLWKT